MAKLPAPDRFPGLVCWVLLAGLLPLQLLLGQPATLHLRNGDRLTGTIATEDTNRVIIVTSWGKEIEIPVSEIVKREEAAAPAPPVPAPATNQVAAPAPAPKPSPPQEAVKPKPPKYWTGDIQLGADLLFSERNRQLYTGRAKVTYAQKSFRTIFDYIFSYGRTDGVLTANRMDGSIKTDFDVAPKVYVYNLVGSGYDEIRRIDIRYEAGPGVGYHLLRLKNFVMNVEAGLNYQAQHFDDGRVNESFYYRLAEDSTWKINSRFTLDEKLEYFPQVGDLGEYRLRFESNLRYWLWSNISLNVTVIDLYDTEPASAVNRNDLQVRSSLGIKF